MKRQVFRSAMIASISVMLLAAAAPDLRAMDGKGRFLPTA